MNETWWRGENDLDDDQKEVIGLPIDKDHLILGPPGSGKTNLLLLRANYLHLGEYPNVLVLVFTRTLQEFLVAGASNYSFSAGKIQTYSFWQHKFLSDNGIQPVKLDDFEQHRKALFDQVMELVEREQLENYYDAIVIDEAQDYLPEEIPLFKKLAKVLFVAADPKQKIYAGGDTLMALKATIPSVVELNYHYRNGEKICAVADEIAKSSRLNQLLLPTCNYGEALHPSEAKLIRCPNLETQCQSIIESLKIQRVAYPDELLGVLCPTRDDLTKVADALRKSELKAAVVVQCQNDYTSFTPGNQICICTVHSAKGLEFRAVHIPNIDNVRVFRERQKRVLYTAITRAKTTLTAYFTSQPPGYIESAFAVAEPRKQVKIRDAFGQQNVDHNR